MKSVLLASALLLTSLSFAQQQSQPPQNGPPQTTPPTFPRTERPQDRIPPDQRAQPLSTAQVQEQIQQGLNSEPTLADTKVTVKSKDDSVILGGTVASEKQHELAVRTAQSYAGERKIVDKIKVQIRT